MKEVYLERHFDTDGFESPIECHQVTLRVPKNYIGKRIHYHQYIELIYALEGDTRAWISGSTVTLREGELLIINTETPHDFESEGETCRHICVKFLPDTLCCVGHPEFDARYVSCFLGNSSEPYHIFVPDAMSAQSLKKCFLDSFSEWKAKKVGYEIALRKNVSEIFLFVLRELAECGRYDFSKKETALSYGGSIIDRSLEYARKNFSTVTMSEAAAGAGVSESYYSRLFKKVKGRNFSEYMNEYRINQAEKMLVFSQMSVTEIAFKAGFSTTSHFICAFKKIRGCTPAKYRNMKNKPV